MKLANPNLDTTVKDLSANQMKIGKILYTVTPIFRENTDITIVTKISRLIQTEAAKSFTS